MAHEQTSWVPQLRNGGSWATRLAEAIAADVASGRLAPGEQLPTQRALARQLGVTTGTVNRGYAIAERAGLVSAEVGRGTFVTTLGGSTIHDMSVAREATGAVELGINYPASTEADALLGDALTELGRRQSVLRLLALSPYAGRESHRAAGARWLRQFGVSANPEDVLMCSGMQHGLAATLAALTAPGDVVLTEELTSPGIKSFAAMHHLRLVPVGGDADGLSPEALAGACRATSARVLYTMPTVHTPTTTTMPDDRRRAVAEVIRREQLVVVEDDAWGFLAEGSVTPLQTLAPDRVVFLSGVSKSIAPGLRVGYVVAPASLSRAITMCIGSTTWIAPMMGELFTQWIEDGTATTLVQGRIRMAAERQRLAGDLLGTAFTPSAIPAFHLWIQLPEPWRVEEFVAHGATLGVSLAATDNFVPGRAPTPHAIRVCTGTEASKERLVQGLGVVARMLVAGPAAFSITGM